LKDTVVQEIEEGRRLGGPRIGEAERLRTEFYHRVREFMKTYEFLIFPVTQVVPFDVKRRYVTEIEGIPMETYIDWMKTCYYVTMTGLPAISVPCGFTPGGLPVGVQIVGRHQDDLGVLQLAHAFEEATGFWQHKPPVAR
jgi:amidase